MCDTCWKFRFFWKLKLISCRGRRWKHQTCVAKINDGSARKLKKLHWKDRILSFWRSQWCRSVCVAYVWMKFFDLDLNLCFNGKTQKWKAANNCKIFEIVAFACETYPGNQILTDCIWPFGTNMPLPKTLKSCRLASTVWKKREIHETHKDNLKQRQHNVWYNLTWNRS